MGKKKVTKVLIISGGKGGQHVRSALKGHKQMQVVGETTNWRDAARKIKELSPDLLLAENAEENGEMDRQLRKLTGDTRVLVIAAEAKNEAIVEWLKLGVMGCLLGKADRKTIEQAIEAIMEGGAFLSPEAAKILLQEYLQTTARLSRETAPLLSQREKQVLVLIVNGKTNKEAAAQLGLGVRTIETHRERLMRKLKVRNSAQLTKYAVENGLAD